MSNDRLGKSSLREINEMMISTRTNQYICPLLPARFASMFSSLYVFHLVSYLIDFPPLPAGFVLYINIQTDDFVIPLKKKKKNLKKLRTIF